MKMLRIWAGGGRVWSLLALLVFAGGWAVAEDAVVEYLEGSVTIETSSGTFDADFGSIVSPGETVVTAPGSLAIVRLNVRSQVKLRENTELRIEDASETAAVTLNSGGVFARVARQAAGASRALAGFEVRTPTVVAGVRGTQFFVAYGRTIEEEADLWLCVNEGEVEVIVPETGQETVVAAGEGINILSGRRATEPRFYPWTRDLNWNFDPEAGEIVDTTDLDGAYADLLDQDYD